MLRGALPPSHMTFSPRSYVTNKIYISTSTIRKVPTLAQWGIRMCDPTNQVT